MPKGRIPIRTALAQRALELALAELGKTTTVHGTRLVLREREYSFDSKVEYHQHIFWSGKVITPYQEYAALPVRAYTIVSGIDKVCAENKVEVCVWVKTNPDYPVPASGRYVYTPREDAIERSSSALETHPPVSIMF